MRYLAALLLLAADCLGAGFTESLAFRGQSSSDSLRGGLVAAWSFDEVVRRGNRTDQVNGIVLTDAINDGAKGIGSMRALMGGSATFTNSGGYNLTNTFDSRFAGGAGKSFTGAAWIIGANGNNSWFANGNGTTYDWQLNGGFNWIVTRSDGIAVQISYGGFDPNAFHLYVFGFDSANKQSFLSVDGAAPTTASTSGLDVRNSNFGISLGWLNGACDEVYWWNRVLSAAEIARLAGTINGAAHGLKYPFGGFDAGAAAKNYTFSYLWAVTNVGGYVTASSSNAVYNYFSNIVSANIDAKINCALSYCPDTLQAALIPLKTPYIQAPGNDIHSEMFDPYSSRTLYGQAGWTISDLTGNGLAGDEASTKYSALRTPTTLASAPSVWPTPNDSGFSIYLFTAGKDVTSAPNAGEFGIFDGGVSPTYGISMTADNGSGIARIFDGDIGTVLLTNPPSPGFYSANRDSSTSSKLFYGNGNLAIGTYVTTNFSSTVANFRTFDVFIGAINFGGSPLGSTNTVSYLSTHTHFTQTEAGNEMNAAQGMRQTFGGGYSPNLLTADTTNMAVLFGNNRSMAVAATGATAYQWQKNGANIAGATQSSYTVTGAALGDFGTYRCTITISGVGIVNSSAAQLATVTTTTASNWVQQTDIAASPNSSNTIWAVDQFWNGMVADGSSAKYVSINCYVPDSFAACLVPLLNTGGANWVNHGFTPSQFTVNGLINSGSEFLDTGLTDSAAFSSVNDIGFTIYFFAAPSDTGLIGIITPDFQGGYLMNASRSGNAEWFDYGPGSGGLGNLHAASPGAGYYCGTRTAANAEAFYFANSSTAHAALATGSTAPAEALTGQNIYIFNCSGLNVIVSGKRISYTSISKGLTSTESSNQYNRVQTLRTVLGGGFQ